ncbi:6423_t:CDS:2 [Cetraspora pellucida]|uniref:6423_t:CDS:1 n=1 Tax=Cetraspora pellucida TaxID=1433469 RepID=A0A9N9HGE3_9GLOM|nr:6423_t:CDS:2 [Cetraspora pellucida]
MSGKFSELKEKQEFSYFISTPHEDWDALEYHREWQAKKYEMSKTKVKIAITRQLDGDGIRSAGILASYWIMVLSGDGIRSNDSNPGGRIQDFWASIFADKKAEFKKKVVAAKVREIQSDKCLIMNKRSLDVLKETVVEYKEASVILADFTRDGQDENPFIEEEENDIIIDDVPCEFSFKNGDPANDLHMGETYVSLLFRNYQKQSLNIARDKGLFVESNVQEILSLSSILLLASNSYSNTMTDHFGLSLLDEIHQKFKSEQQIILDLSSETTFRKAVKMTLSESRDDAIIWLCENLKVSDL